MEFRDIVKTKIKELITKKDVKNNILFLTELAMPKKTAKKTKKEENFELL